MKKVPYTLFVSFIFLFSCKKQTDIVSSPKQTTAVQAADQYTKYTIYQGHQYCDQSTYVPVDYSELKFSVKFDSSAIYKTVLTSNQNDINKLLGFSDNNEDHHQFSARFGWRWSDNALYLFGYTYNNGVMSWKKLGAVKIGAENSCSIKVKSNFYIFSLNDAVDSMQRLSTTPQAKGYKLYPYFGGDEPAPHDINIWIKEIK